MKLNKASLFALMAVLELASDTERQLSTTDIAEKHDISTHHLAKVMRHLVHEGVVQAMRGVGGGYRFAGNINRMTLLDIIQLFETLESELDVPKGCRMSVKVVPLEVKFPQGSEKQMIKAVLGLEVPPGNLPMDVGAVVQNVATAAAIYQAVRFGRPLIDRIVTVTGPGITEPRNLRVRIGTLFSDVVEQCGGLKEATAKVLMGGPMMGIAQAGLMVPVIKGTSGIVALTGKGGGRIGELLTGVDVHLCVPHAVTARIQEVHLLCLHCLCDAIDCLLLGVE